MSTTPIHDRLLAEFRSLHYGRDPGTDRTFPEQMRSVAVAMSGAGAAARKAGAQLATTSATVKAAQRRASQPRDPRLRTTTKRSRQ